MRANMLISVFLILTIVIGLSGCSTFSNKNSRANTSGLLEPQAILKFNDVPVPVGFKLLYRESYSFESSGVRVGLLKYQAKADIDQVVNFYKEQMRMYNWDLLNTIEYGQRQLNFDRESETCIVTLNAKGRLVSITVALGPKATFNKKKSDKPVK